MWYGLLSIQKFSKMFGDRDNFILLPLNFARVAPIEIGINFTTGHLEKNNARVAKLVDAHA